MQPNDIFFQNVPGVGKLVLRKSLIENDLMIVLSILVSESGDMFLNFCCEYSKGIRQRWVLVKISPIDLIKCLFSEVDLNHVQTKSFFKMHIVLDEVTGEMQFDSSLSAEELEVFPPNIYLNLFRENETL